MCTGLTGIFSVTFYIWTLVIATKEHSTKGVNGYAKVPVKEEVSKKVENSVSVLTF